MNFETYGPFEINWWKDNDRWEADIWKGIEEVCEGLSAAIGCYVFCLRWGDKYLPWYVGKTINKNGFKGEVFQKHKLDHYENLMNVKPNHKPHLMLFPLMTDEHWNFSKNRSQGSDTIEWLETTLITMAHAANPEIKNKSKTSKLHYVYVNGLVGSQYAGRKSDAAKVAAQMFKPQKPII